ncbi:MAG: hypothetical protein HIU83_11695 [Proteobacteria bacterium]|nr:hypothetical protein [Pseudomonadota bacterium]
MKRDVSWLGFLYAAVAVMIFSGCAGNQQGYQKAFNSQSALTQNQCGFKQPCDAVFKIVKQTLVQQGFTIESADFKSGMVKAVRDMQDKDNPDISYNIHASVDISDVAGSETNISLAASQQTILHRSTTTWWHLLWVLPIIPTGTEYQTLVIKEGNITEPAFYTDFFNNLKIAVTKYDIAVKAAAKVAAEKAEAERIKAEKAARLKAVAEAKIAAEKAEAARIEAEKANVTKLEAEKAEAALVAAEIAAKQKGAEETAKKAEADRITAEQAVEAKLVAENEANKVSVHKKKTKYKRTPTAQQAEK